MNKNLKDQDVLLVKEKDKDEVKVVAGINPDNGKLESVSPKPENQPDFMKIDRHGNMLGNFLENFSRQFKNPTHFLFFKTSADKAEETANKLQAALKNPETPENKKVLDAHKVETPQKEYKISPDFVQWDKLEKFGITREGLGKTGISKDGTTNLDRLLNYDKTNLMPVVMKFEDETLRSDARISLKKMEDGSFAPSVHLIRKEPELERPYFGIKFTEEDKNNLRTTGNLGRVVEAEFKQGEKTQVLLSLDKQTNELVTFRKEWLKIPDTYKGAQLNGEQKQKLSNGEKVEIKGMTSTGGKPFDGEVQFNADKRYFTLIIDNDRKQEQSQRQGNRQDDVYRTFRKKALTGEQRDSLREGKTVYVDGLVDKNGKGYTGYITWNKEQRNYDFMFPKDYKEAVANGKVIPDDRSKTQVAVNSEGKTNEATKNVKEPLEKGQTQPTENQAAKQAAKQEQEKPKKGKGLKM
jgi:hypothetical protein